MNLHVARVTDDVIRAALQSSMIDFEDAVTSEAAKVAGAEIIVTRNTSDYKTSSIPAILPEEFFGDNIRVIVVSNAGKISAL